MASSRIFVRGLPPSLTEEEFRSHFSQHHSITDVRLFPHRRIGYVGYKTATNAEKAVKYFNKSFIRMSRITVEFARPVADETLQKPRQSDIRAPRIPSDSATVLPTTNPLKRKRDANPDAGSNPRLKEFLNVMQPPSKVKTWANEEVFFDPADKKSNKTLQEAPQTGTGSDSEYQTVPKYPKTSPNQEAARPMASETSTDDMGKGHEDSVDVEEQSLKQDGPVPPITAEDVAMSDDEWLRSRTSKILDLDEAVEQGKDTPPAPDDGGTGHGPHAALAPPALEKEPEPPEAEAKESAGSRSGGATVTTDAVMATGRLFVRNLPYDVSEDDLRDYFLEYGLVDEVHVPLDSKSGNAKGFAYVQFNKPENAVEALKAQDGTIFQGRLIQVLPATAKRESKLDEEALAKLPLKKQRLLQRKAAAASSTFNWNSLYMNIDAVMSSIADRLGVAKSTLLDPTSSDAAVKQAQAETHIIQETKSYFAQNGVDLEAFTQKQRGDIAILVKNFPYGTKREELQKLFEEHGQVVKLLMPPSGTLAIVEFATPPQARSAFASLAYRKFKDSLLFLEKAPKDLFKQVPASASDAVMPASANATAPKFSALDLLESNADAPVDTSTLFVRNLNFSTTSQQLTELFKPLDGFLSARVKTKADPKHPGQVLSMGFGFLEFRTKQQAQVALSAMDGYALHGHSLQIKASHKGMDAAEERRKELRAKKAAGQRTKILIKNLPFEATKKDVRALFGSYGQLRSVRVPKKFDNSTRGFAFADFTTPREAENALDALRNTHLLGRRLVLDFADEDPDDAEAEIEKMQRKVGSQVNKVALQKLTGAGRKKFNVAGNGDLDEP